MSELESFVCPRIYCPGLHSERLNRFAASWHLRTTEPHVDDTTRAAEIACEKTSQQ